MKVVPYLLNGQYLSTLYDYYLSGHFPNPDAAMVGTSMESANGIYCANLGINGSFALYMGRLPDRLWGLLWSTPPSTRGLSVVAGGARPTPVYTLLLDNSGVLNVQADGSTIWKSPGPSNPGAGSYFASIDNDGNLTLSTGTPSNPGSVYWSSGSSEGSLIIQRTASSGQAIAAVSISYLDVRNGKPGNTIELAIGDTSASRVLRWPGMLAASTDPNYLKSLPAALRLTIGEKQTFPYAVVELGVCRTLTLSVTDDAISFPLGFGVAASA